MKGRLLWFHFLIITLAVGCTQPGTLETEGPVHDDRLFDRCLPPCWIGIEPGITNRTPTIELLEVYYGPENIRIEDESLLRWGSEQVDNSSSGWIRFDNEIVEQIGVRFLEDRVSVGKIVEELGEPTSVQITIASDGINCAGASLLYPDLETKILLYPHEQSVGVSKDQSVYELVFSTQGVTVLPPTDTFSNEWEGYREYCTLPQ
jgi:hypothetical protein